MKIFLVYLSMNTYQNYGYNYGLGYISSVLKNNGFAPEYITLKSKKDLMFFFSAVKDEKPDIIAFSLTTTQYNFLKVIVRELRKITDSYIVCGGIHATLDPESVIEIPEVDCLIRGEGEFAFLELVKAKAHGLEYYNIKNCWFKNKNAVIKNEIRPLIENLDELPSPDLDCIDFQEEIDLNNSSIRFIFSRGCPFECTYCSNKALSQVFPNSKKYFRQLSPELAIAEIEEAKKKYRFDNIDFDDDTITLNKKWFYDFFGLYKKKFKFPFRCNIRVGTVTDDMMRLLKECGAYGIGIGIEHGNEEFRKKVLNRNMTNKQIIDTFKMCKKYGIENRNNFIMVGLPNENKKLFLDTVKLCRKIINEGDASIFYPYPGTPLGQICQKNGWLPDKQFYLERVEACISYPEFSKEQIQLCHDSFRYFIKNKSIPLFTPLEIVPAVYSLFESLKIIKNYFGKRIKKVFHWNRIA